MWVESLSIDNLRNVVESRLSLCSGLNLFTGPNGAGKTTVIEALFMLAHGRSFRSRSHTDLVTHGQKAATVFCQLRSSSKQHKIGLQRDASGTVVRLDGENSTVAESGRLFPLRLFEPNSHELVDGSAGGRRQFIDWGVFHVEHSFLTDWRRYQAAVRHRNVQLRKGASDRELSAFEPELVRLAETISAHRHAYVDALSAVFPEVLKALSSELNVRLVFSKGWPDDVQLKERLERGRADDRARGHMLVGAHRADLKVLDDRGPIVRRYSRGQTKVVALALVLSQLRLHEQKVAGKAVLCLDDVAAELDDVHQARLFEWLNRESPQVVATSVMPPSQLDVWSGERLMFHVEHGKFGRA